MKKIISAIQERRLLLFLLMWVVTGILYLPAYKAGFIADFEGLLAYATAHDFIAFVNSVDFSVKSLYQVTQFQLYIWIHLLGRHPVPWFILITGLHAVNGTLVYSFFKGLLGDFRFPRAAAIALAGALLFLLNPNITEITIWKGGYHYLTGVMMQLLILSWCRAYLLTGHKRFVTAAVALFFISTFTLEMFYLTPWFCLMLILGYRWKGIITRHKARSSFGYIFVPQLLFFLLHLLIVRIRFGTWLPHYGTTNEFFFLPANLFPSAVKYLSTLVLMTAQMPYDYYSSWYAFLAKPIAYNSFLVLCLLLIALVLVRFKKASPGFQVTAFLFGMMLFCLAIIVPIYFDDVMQLYNSRRCYALGIAVYMLLAVSLFRIVRNAKLAWTIYAAYLLLCIGLTVKKMWQWRHAEQIQAGMLRNYKWQDKDTVVLLNMPAYFKDVRIIPVNKDRPLHENLLVFGYPLPKGEVYGVTSYNMVDVWNGVHVNVLDSNTLKVTLNQWGSWWMYNDIGATDYENDLYRFRIGDGGLYYTLSFKHRPAGMIILYQQGDQWRQVDMDKKPGEEQW